MCNKLQILKYGRIIIATVNSTHVLIDVNQYMGRVNTRYIMRP